MKRTRHDDAEHSDSIKHKKSNESTADEEYFERKLKEANEGLTSSQYLIGLCYDMGFGVKQNPNIAMEWYMKASEQSHIESCFELALDFEYGIGTRSDITSALKWFEKAISLLPSNLDQASSQVLYFIGVLHWKGITGYQKDREKAIEYFTKAANQPVNDASNRVETGR